MRIKHLFIKKFKNLRDFQIDFGTESSTAVLVGRNGTGKSNLLEALTIIFRDLDLGEGPNLTYFMDYECRGHKVRITTFPDEPRKKAMIAVDGKEMTYNQLSSNKEYLPNFVFGYYSGPSRRMEEHFDRHQERFYRDLLDNVERPLRRLFFARLVHSQFVLLAFFLEEDKEIKEFLGKYLRIEGLDSVLFVMRQPPWAQKVKDPLKFWGARGVVRGLLDKLFELSLAPLQLTQKVPVAFGKSQTLQHLYLYLKDVERLREFARGYKNQQELFKALESTYISKLISEVRIRVKARNIEGALTFRELSEGEQQLLMVLGLLRFTREDESLFLLDEPDTHLNPAWSLEYFEMLKNVVGEQSNSHILMATHDPLVITGLERSQVQIMRREEESGRIFAEMPNEDPKGMGIAGLLTSDVYGLRSQLDLETLKLLDKKRSLAVKETLTDQEKDELEKLNEQLAGLDFTKTVRDPLYEQFVNAQTKLEKEEGLQVAVLTKAQQEKQKELALEVLKKLKPKEEQKARLEIMNIPKRITQKSKALKKNKKEQGQ
jgi:predicted ATPase